MEREGFGTGMARGAGFVSMMALSKPWDDMLGDCYLGSLGGWQVVSALWRNHCESSALELGK